MTNEDEEEHNFMKILKIRYLLVFVCVLSFVNLSFAERFVRFYYKKITDYQYDFYADNTNTCPYQLLANLDFDSNYQLISTNLPYYTIISPMEQERYLFSLMSLKPLTNDFKFRYDSSIGDPNLVQEDTNFLYYMPFQEGEEHRVNQGYNTRFSHKGWTKYSVDIGMPIGTPVCAARDGTIVDIVVKHSHGGRSRRYRDCANYITVSHADGTFSQYVHLKKGGSLVNLGDKVKAGQPIGLSGNTGWTSGPHLHFMAFKPIYMGRMTFPTQFLGTDSNPFVITNHQFYYSYHGNMLSNSAISNITKVHDTNTEESPLGGP